MVLLTNGTGYLSAISPNMINPKTKPKRLMIAVDSNFIF